MAGDRHGFGVPIPPETQPNQIAAKDLSLQRPVAKYDHSSSSGLLFGDNHSLSHTSTSDSSESPTLLKNPTLVYNTSVSPSPLFGNSNSNHRNTPMMDSAFKEPSTTSLDVVSGIYTFQPHPNPSDCLVDDFDDMSFFITPQTNDTSFTHSTFTSSFDTPSINLAQIDSYLSSTSLSDQDFNLYGDGKGLNMDEWYRSPLFNSGSLAEDPVAPYEFFKSTNATVTSASPQQLIFSSIRGSKPEEPLPSPELSPPTTRKSALRRSTLAKPTSGARRISTTPFTPITPAPTTPSTPQPVITRATKRRLPVIDEDPAVVEKRRRNTIAAQRSRARKQEEKAEDRARITRLQNECDSLRLLLSYWKDRACELGASPLEDGET